MEKMTRMSKYKELRESLKNDVITTESTQNYVANEEMVKDLSYYRNLVGEEIKQPVKEDTLIESMTFETITENETEEVKGALEKVRENSGLDQYNTRLDILNKIRQAKVEKPVVEMKEEVEEIHEDQQENEEVIQENRFGYVKEETETQIDEEEVDQEPKKKFSFFKKKEETEELEEENVEEDVEDQEESTFLIKLLNGFIIVLVLVLVALVAFIAKEVLF